MSIDMTKFCATDDDTVALFKRPIIHSGLEVATDAKVIVFRRADPSLAATELHPIKAKQVETICSLIIDETNKGGWQPWPTIPALCQSCKGALFVACPKCRGTPGEFVASSGDRYPYCIQCGLEGIVACPTCNMRRVGVEFSGHWFDAALLRRLEILPGKECRLAQGPVSWLLIVAWTGGWAAVCEYDRDPNGEADYDTLVAARKAVAK